MTRRDFGKVMGPILMGAAFPSACVRKDNPTYEELVAATWRHSDDVPRSGLALQKELVRYATLAPNSHNTQPWRFRLAPNRITVLPDFGRRCPAVDPDDHHLFVSLGCAVENLALAAEAHGLHAKVTVDDANGDAIQVDLESGRPSKSALFLAIPERQCTRAGYDGKAVPLEQMGLLEAAAKRDTVGVQVFTGKGDLDKITEYVVAGNTAQMDNEAFVKELKEWLRFNRTAAVEHRDGLFSAASGNPTMPTWLSGIVFRIAFTKDAENDKYRDHIGSSAGVIALVSERDDKKSWIEVGRSYQRFALQATALGVRHAHVNQAIEVPEIRAQFAEYLGIGDRRPDLLVRFGYGPELPRSLRRPVDAVIV